MTVLFLSRLCISLIPATLKFSRLSFSFPRQKGKDKEKKSYVDLLRFLLLLLLTFRFISSDVLFSTSIPGSIPQILFLREPMFILWQEPINQWRMNNIYSMQQHSARATFSHLYFFPPLFFVFLSLVILHYLSFFLFYLSIYRYHARNISPLRIISSSSPSPSNPPS